MTELTLDVRSVAPPESVFGSHPVMRSLVPDGGPYRRLDLTTVLLVTKRWREAILTYSNGLSGRVRELLSGHDPEGAPLEVPHLALLPLAVVGNANADGRLLGMALTLPREVSPDVRREAFEAIIAVRHLALGRLGMWKLVTQASVFRTWSLRPEAWTAHPMGATQWSTVTPVVFDRHPKTVRRERNQHEVAAMIRKACTRIGLPEPREVVVTAVSALIGTPPAFAFPRLPRKNGGERRHTHAILVFDRPVCGPVVIGAGRYRGYGFCQPLDKEDLGNNGRKVRGRERVRMGPR